MKKVILIYLMLGYFANAQDVHFSQYYLSPLTLNPANTGNFRGDYRFMGNYRTQWRDLNNAFETFSAGGDLNFYPSNLNVSGGLLFVNDRSAQNLVVNKIMPSGAWHVKIAGFKLHAGIQPAIVIKSIDFNSHTFPNQLNWDKGGFDNTLPNNEAYARQNFFFLDLNAGLGAGRRFGKLETEIYFGFFHLNGPKESFFANNNNRLPVRHAYNLALAYPLGSKIVLRAHSVYGFTTRAKDWVNGMNVEYILSNQAFFTNSVYAGFMWRNGIATNPDAGIVTLGMNYSHYTIGFSYDITISQLKTSVNSKGAFEIALIYRGKSTRLSKKVIPCERY